MRLVRVGTAAVSVKVGDYEGNAQRLREVISAAREDGVHLLTAPELCISGYSLEDRIQWPDVVRHSWQTLEELAEDCRDISVFLGLPVRVQGLVYNAAAFVSHQKIRGLILKRFLPTYSIFYEGRNWTAWQGGVTQVNGVPAGDLVFKMPYGGVSAEICEDLWTASSPARERVLLGADIICNPSASPFTPRKNEERKRLVGGTASNLKAVYVYANLLGCDNSRLVFDGGGLIATPTELVCEAPILSKEPWTLASAVVNLDEVARLPASFYAPEQQPLAQHWTSYYDELFDALVLGLRDYFEKVGVFDRFLLALSGGRDSALCLLMAVEAAKALRGGVEADRYAERVSTIYLPHSRYSSSATENAARALAQELGVPFQVATIQEESEIALEKAGEILGGADKVAPIAKQNLQARIRGAIMLNWANSVRGLVLVTSNLSEAAVGYTTTGGDNQGGFSPIANIPKTLVTQLLDHIAERQGLESLRRVLAIPPSAELAEDQRDEEDLMPYAVLDDLLYLYAKRRLPLADCWRLACHRHQDYDPEQLRAWTADFARRFATSQWKRDQHPVALKVMDLDLDPKTGFRFPVTQSIERELADLAKAEVDLG